MAMDVRYLLCFMLALLASLMLIPLLIRHSARLGLVDDGSGDARKLHTGVMPRSGGLGIIVASAMAVLLVLTPTTEVLSFLAAALVVILFGLLDDMLTLRPLQKLGGQALAVAIAMAGGMVISDVPLIGDAPVWFTYPLTFVFVLGVINGVNFSDGMDGLAAGTTLMSLMLLFILAAEANHAVVAAIALAVSAAVLGFLRFNTHPASIYMGDAGSQFLGFVVAWLAITLSQSDLTPMTTLMPLLILGLPVLDIVQVVPVRVYKKLPLPGPDKEHFHHQIAKLGLFSYEVVAIIYALQAVLLASAYLLRYGDDLVVLAYFVVFAVLVLGGGLLAHLHGFAFRDMAEVAARRRRNRFFRALSPLHPYTGKFFGLLLLLTLCGAALVSDNVSPVASVFGLVVGVGAIAVHLLTRDRWQQVLPRTVSYIAAGTLVYGLSATTQSESANLALNVAFAVWAVLLAVAIRITRKVYFWLTNQDLLVVLFVVMLAPQLPIDLGPGIEESALVFRTAVVLYTCEFVLARGDQARLRLLYSSAFAMLLLAGHLAL